MSDNKNKQGWQDDDKIDPNSTEINYAMKRWGVTRQQILDAMKATHSRSRRIIYGYLVGVNAITDEEE